MECELLSNDEKRMKKGKNIKESPLEQSFLMRCLKPETLLSISSLDEGDELNTVWNDLFTQ